MRYLAPAVTLAVTLAGCGAGPSSPESLGENRPAVQASFANFKAQFGPCLAGTAFDVEPPDTRSPAIFIGSDSDDNTFFVHQAQGPKRALSFEFNATNGKFEPYEGQTANTMMLYGCGRVAIGGFTLQQLLTQYGTALEGSAYDLTPALEREPATVMAYDGGKLGAFISPPNKEGMSLTVSFDAGRHQFVPDGDFTKHTLTAYSVVTPQS